MKSLTSHEGYLLIDNSAAGEGKLELATITCCHCNKVQYKNPARIRPRGYCPKCDDYVCDDPVCRSSCMPFKKVMDDLYEQNVRSQNG